MSADRIMPSGSDSPVVIVGIACRVPGADSVNAFAEMLFDGATGYGELPADRCDREFYFESQKGKVGKSYTTLGGIVPERPLNRSVCPLPFGQETLSDAAHVQFAEVAATAWRNARLVPRDKRLQQTGVYVGHSGGTKSGGGLSLATQIEEALSFLDDIDLIQRLSPELRTAIAAEAADSVRKVRPSRQAGAIPCFHAYQAAALTAQVLELTGPRSVIDAACASSLVALSQAILAIRAGRLDSAIVGGATYNNVDNLILFSHSQACTAVDSRPFDDRASGLVSSEGYVAIVITTQDRAARFGLPVLGMIQSVGIASDGKGRSLWAPRMEGQVLALQRAYAGLIPLDIDYMEAHATSTQLGDATELETLRQLAASSPALGKNIPSDKRLLLGSVKSNIGHTLEAAGLLGVVKVLIAMQRREIPPSLRFEKPNHNYDWSTAPVRVVTKREGWPDKSLHRRSRRAAVSAFGIGGLNAHVVVEECAQTVPERSLDQRIEADCDGRTKEHIAIVGRGIVVAGARSIREFRDVLEAPHTRMSVAPEGRWRKQAGVAPHSSPQTYKTPHAIGGFIQDFTFDGARYRIPPKQVQQANPVQMMLLDAVSQALEEVAAGCDVDARGNVPESAPSKVSPEWPVDRARIGVVIGTIFGGEFGDQLQVGMRLPEICARLSEAMHRRGIPTAQIQQATSEFRQIILKNRPALLDETGSFTASTLASRVAKTFDLMGGACALDSDDTSGLAALTVAADQLRAGTCDMIVCGSAQRSMSLSSFEALDMTGRLVRTGRPEDVPDDCQQILPGEGVVTLILCRLSDAERLKLPIHGIITDVAQREPGELPGLSSGSVMNAADAAIVRKIGYLSGAHSLIRITAETLSTPETGQQQSDDNPHEILISAKTSDGIVLQTCLHASAGVRALQAEDFSSSSRIDPEIRIPSNPQVNVTMTHSFSIPDRHFKSFRFGAPSGSELIRLLRNSIGRVEQLFDSNDETVLRSAVPLNQTGRSFTSADCCRAVVLAADPAQLRDRLNAAVKATEAGKFQTVLDRERVVLWQTKDDAARIAWLFPGQGSHYPDRPMVFSASEVARQTLTRVDEIYASHNLPRLSTAFGNSSIKPGEDVWWAQAWVLGVSAALTDALKAEGFRPDAVLGHSFGEFTASLASNVTTLAQTIELARHRANAVVSHMRTSGGLLSVRAAVHEVDAVLKSAALPVYVTHLNSPRQTVIAGSREGIMAARALLDQQGFAAMAISVPAPFHTPLLENAEMAFERLSASVPMRPPVNGFLSATSVQYLAEPSGIRHSLVRQLTQPVMYMPSIHRMLGEGFRVFLEVGPNDVLTRMNRDIVDSQALCLSLDVPGQPFEERVALVRAAIETVTGMSLSSVATLPTAPLTSISLAPAASIVAETNPENAVFDVTRSRRGGRKQTQEISSDLPETENNSTYEDRSGSREAQDKTAAPSDVPSHAVSLQPSAAPVFSDAQLRTFVRDLVVELTGYSPDIVDFEADLEADLGIDSIKKAQILGELGEWMGLTVRPESLRLDAVRTLNDAVCVASKLAQESVAEHHPEPAREILEPEKSERQAPAKITPSSSAGTNRLPSADRLDSLLIDHVVDQTGYARDIVDIDAELEAELGLDSIKLAQLIGEMRDQFNLESITLDSIAQARFRTLRGIREFLMSHGGDGPSAKTLDGTSQQATSQQNSTSHSPNAGDSVSTADRTSADFSLHFRSNDTERHTSSVAESFHTDSSQAWREPLLPDAVAIDAVAIEDENTSSVRGAEPIEELTAEMAEWFQLPGNPAPESGSIVDSGVSIGRRHRNQIRAALRFLINQPFQTVVEHEWSAAEAARLRGVAAGAGVSEASVRLAASFVRNKQAGVYSGSADSDRQNQNHTGKPESGLLVSEDVPRKTNRYALRVVPAPRRGRMPLVPELHGAALILGANPLADAIAVQIQKLGQKALVVRTDVPVARLEQMLKEHWERTPTPHLFLTMAFDPGSAKNLTESDWKHRRAAALEAPFRICQLWMQQTIDSGLMEDASVVSVTQLGGDFGFSGKKVRSIEAIGGLVKAMLIEAWMRGFRTTPMKAVDAASDMTAEEIAHGVLQELAVPSYDMEIAFRSSSDKARPERLSVQAVAAPLRAEYSLADRQRRPVRMTRGGTWIVSGGGRGITAVIAMTLAKKYELKLHMLGTAPAPDLSDAFVQSVAADRSAVRRTVMQEASSRGDNPVEAWRNMEKAIEIDATLRECRRAGITATYHCCDVSDFAQVSAAVKHIRNHAGTIHGVIHGAGAGQDARFDRKRPDKVEKCLQAKIDGTIALMQATQNDPLEYLITFGSISGRFGANGHTDYSLANDMMAKIVDRYRSQRPEVCSLTFHWHAWGDIGMATKPEAKLALEMIDMEFMPARDGIEHFMNELELGGDEPEVLITDENYFRKFFPAERLSVASSSNDTLPLPLIPATVTQHADEVCTSVVTLNPTTDKFLSQHRVQGRPTLPFVVALELMAEAVRARTGNSNAGVCTEARALQAIRFSTDDPLAVTVQTRPAAGGGIECRLLADVRRRDGRMVEEDREYFRAVFLNSSDPNESNGTASFDRPQNQNWKRIQYATPEGLIYHGPELQELREIFDDGQTVFGRIAASAAVQLFGGARSRGFTVPCATMDACLYAVGYAAWHRHQKPSLPVRFERIEFGRLPDPGEPCLVKIRQTHLSDSGAVWNFQLQGHNRDRLMNVTGYAIGWLKNN